ncbi:ribosomal RNA large subunit methyltransferase N [Radiomyces spectabilis]|uniref:ribosomal RNA large subunit methyltransferase N n=1 Tax=Radiomyces spectabilis TaxID=64574 RepID=UPI00221F7CFF|nr:ribosomal RNA large subunit methyltransferase N [Radiomyces spectabilis]KAI8376047.1 ribosomal RNA large subunit methyltransferase N [Radiomyces spectabilis]
MALRNALQGWSSVPGHTFLQQNMNTVTSLRTGAIRTMATQYGSKKNLIGLSLQDLQQELATVKNIKKYTALQIWQHMYQKGCTSFDEMSTLSKDLRSHLKEYYMIHYGDVQLDRTAKDTTRKFLIGFNTRQDPGAIVETVMIPESRRVTLCVSSQIGCSLKCSFCHTGTQKLLRNLTAAEVVGQFMIAASRAGDFPLRDDRKRIVSNAVFMGQGEPGYNWRNVSKAIKILTDPQGLDWSKHKITISTSGVAPVIPKIASELGVSLAISLHATNNQLRNELVPLNKTYPLDTVLAACREYAANMGKKGRRITFEYVMLRGVNDSAGEARELVRLLKQLPAHVNLIPFNPWPGSGYQSSTAEQVQRFANIVMEGGIHCTVRRPRGQDILAACGQLKSSLIQSNRLGSNA